MSFSRDEWPGGKNLATTPVIWRRMFQRHSPSRNFGLNYDPSHLVLQQMDPISPLARVQAQVLPSPCQGHDCPPERLNEMGIFAFPKEWHTPRIPGLGDINWARFMAALYEIGYDGPVCIEVEDDTFGKKPGRPETGAPGSEERFGTILMNSEGGKGRRRRENSLTAFPLFFPSSRLPCYIAVLNIPRK